MDFMFICLCNGITDKEILCAIDRGIDTLDALSSEFNVGTICGCCEPDIQNLIDRYGKKKNSILSFIKIE